LWHSSCPFPEPLATLIHRLGGRSDWARKPTDLRAKNTRVIETNYRSNDCSYLSLPDDTAEAKPQRNPNVIQPALLAFDENHQQEGFSRAFFGPSHARHSA